MRIKLLDIGPVNVSPDNGNRYVLLPGDGISHMTNEEQTAINDHWDEEVSPGKTRAVQWAEQVAADNFIE